MGKVFANDERGWISTVAEDLARWRSMGGSTPSFLRAAAASWWQRFPYLHPRLVNHHPHTSEERSRTFYGEGFFGLAARMRQHLNSAKPQHYKNNKKAPIGPMSGLVQLSETYSDILARLKSEGFYHNDENSPYSRSNAGLSKTLRVGTRLMAYPEADFGCYTNEERKQAQLDLPEDLEDICEVLSRQVGAELYVLAVWPQNDGTHCFYDAVSPASQAYLEPSQELQVLRGTFLDWHRRNTLWRMSATVEDARPAIWGALDGSMRPLYPRHEGPIVQTRVLLAEYLQLLYHWQGGEGAVPYAITRSEHEDSDPAANALVALERLPEGMHVLQHPDEMLDRELTSLVKHIVNGQHGLVSKDARFQFQDLGSGRQDIDYREVRRDGSVLEYGPHSRLYLARILRRKADDTIAAGEIYFQLPHITELTTGYLPFTTEDLVELHNQVSDSEILLRLLGYASSYEKTAPVHGTPAHWETLYLTSLQFPQAPPAWQDGLQGIGGWTLRPAYSQLKSDDGKLSMQQFSRVIRSGVLLHRPTETALAGPYGVKWPILVLIRAYVFLRDVEGKGKRRADARTAFLEQERDTILADAEYLRELVEDSSRRLIQIRQAPLPPFVELVVDSTNVYRATRHVPPVRNENEPPVEEVETEIEPEDAVEQGPPKPRPALHKAGTKRKTRQRVAVELPARRSSKTSSQQGHQSGSGVIESEWEDAAESGTNPGPNSSSTVAETALPSTRSTRSKRPHTPESPATPQRSPKRSIKRPRHPAKKGPAKKRGGP